MSIVPTAATTINRVQVRLNRPHPGQRAVLDCPARFRVLACGRRWGKTTVAQQAAVDAALRGAFVWWVLPDYPMATIVWRSLKETLRPVASEKSEEERRVQLLTGGVVQVKSAHDPDSLRGVGLDLAVLDEAAFMAEDAWTGGIRPALTDRQGRALLLSTPNGHNWFYQAFRRGLDPLQSEWRSFHYRTADSPRIPAHEIDDARASLPERWFQQEYEAEFLEGTGAVFRNVTTVCTAERQEPYAGNFVGGIDWGRENDFTAVAIFDADTGRMVALDRFREIGWEMQRGRVRALYDAWKPGVFWGEKNSIGSVNIEALQSEGVPVLPFETTAQSKTPLIEGLALAMERRETELLNDPVLITELSAYEMERLPSGIFRYSAPPGGHDDTVIAAALGWHGVRRGSFEVLFES